MPANTCYVTLVTILPPSCHPPVTLVTLKNRVQPLYTKGFCHPDTLKHKKSLYKEIHSLLSKQHLDDPAPCLPGFHATSPRCASRG